MERRGFRLVGVMTYEGQVAGVPDVVPTQRARSLIVRGLKQASQTQLEVRRQQVADALAGIVELEFWNAGGSGSVESTAQDPVVTEVAAGSGLLVPTLFDHYQSFEPVPAALFALPVVRRPSAGIATVHGGGLVASGAAGRDRLPVPWIPEGLHLTALEGAGEVQTPLTGPAAARLRVGDLVWFRHAKSGELFEHTNDVRLLAGETFVEHRGDLPRPRPRLLTPGHDDGPPPCWRGPVERSEVSRGRCGCTPSGTTPAGLRRSRSSSSRTS